MAENEDEKLKAIEESFRINDPEFYERLQKLKRALQQQIQESSQGTLETEKRETLVAIQEAVKQIQTGNSEEQTKILEAFENELQEKQKLLLEEYKNNLDSTCKRIFEDIQLFGEENEGKEASLILCFTSDRDGTCYEGKVVLNKKLLPIEFQNLVGQADARLENIELRKKLSEEFKKNHGEPKA